MSSSLDSICKKTALPLETGGAAAQPHEAKVDSARHISPAVAHELNNLLTIIQGYADRLLLKHGGNPEVEGQLKLISGASRRAAILVRNAVRSEDDLPVQPQPNPPPLMPAA